MTLGRKVRELREALNLSQGDLAEAIEVDGSYISQIERGYTKLPSMEIVASLARALRTTPDDLLTAAGYPTGLPNESDEIQLTDLSKIPPSERGRLRRMIQALIREYQEE